MTIRFRRLSGGYVDGTGVHRGVPPNEDDFLRVSVCMAHRMLFAEPFVNDAVYSREQIGRMLDQGDISEARAEEMSRMRYTVNNKGQKVIEDVCR
jgi:hypothetical protein